MVRREAKKTGGCRAREEYGHGARAHFWKRRISFSARVPGRYLRRVGCRGAPAQHHVLADGGRAPLCCGVALIDRAGGWRGIGNAPAPAAAPPVGAFGRRAAGVPFRRCAGPPTLRTCGMVAKLPAQPAAAWSKGRVVGGRGEQAYVALGPGHVGCVRQNYRGRGVVPQTERRSAIWRTFVGSCAAALTLRLTTGAPHGLPTHFRHRGRHSRGFSNFSWMPRLDGDHGFRYWSRLAEIQARKVEDWSQF